MLNHAARRHARGLMGIDRGTLSGGTFLLEAMDGGPEPVRQGLFDFLLGAGFVERRERASGGIERNMPARNFRRTLIAGNELHQQALVARRAVAPRVEVQAGGGIFENERRSPRRMRGPAVAALLEEAQLKFQGVQGVARVSW